MKFDIYQIEKLELELNNIVSIKKDLHNILSYSSSNNSTVLNEIEVLIEKFIKRESDCKRAIEKRLMFSKNFISHIKINTEILKELFSLKKEFDFTSIDITIDALIQNYKIDIYNSNLSKIDIVEIPKRFTDNFTNTKFNICSSKDSDNEIIYTTDDLIINDNIEYLDLKNFKLHNKNESEYYLFSPNFTLADLDDFFNLLIK